MSDQSYREGFKDGFSAGLEEGKKLAPRDNVFQPGILGMPQTCPVCGRDGGSFGVWGYVCTHPKCPTNATCGAVGSSYDISKPMAGDFY